MKILSRCAAAAALCLAAGTAPADHAWFGTEWPSFYPGHQLSWLFPFSPAILILVFPAFLRLNPARRR